MDHPAQGDLAGKDIIPQALESLDWILSKALGVVIINKAEAEKFMEVAQRYLQMQIDLEDIFSNFLDAETRNILKDYGAFFKKLASNKAKYSEKTAKKLVSDLILILDEKILGLGTYVDEFTAYAIDIGLAEYVEYMTLQESEKVKKAARTTIISPSVRRNFEHAQYVWAGYTSQKNKVWRENTAMKLEKIRKRYSDNMLDRIKMIHKSNVASIQEKLIQGELSGQTVAETAEAILSDVVKDPSTERMIPRIFKTPMARAETIVRTELHRARQAALLEIADEKYFTWVTIGRNICIICLKRHGKMKTKKEWIRLGTPTLHPNCKCILIPGADEDSVKGFIPLKPIKGMGESEEGKMPDNYIEPGKKEFKTANKLWVELANYRAKIDVTEGSEKKTYIALRRDTNKKLIEEIERLRGNGLNWVRPS